jgi:hypothetical protein
MNKKIKFINVLIARTYLSLLIVLGIFSLAVLSPNPTIPAIMLITAVVVSLVYIELNKE